MTQSILTMHGSDHEAPRWWSVCTPLLVLSLACSSGAFLASASGIVVTVSPCVLDARSFAFIQLTVACLWGASALVYVWLWFQRSRAAHANGPVSGTVALIAGALLFVQVLALVGHEIRQIPGASCAGSGVRTRYTNTATTVCWALLFILAVSWAKELAHPPRKPPSHTE
jgi:hypothetical protein